MSILISVIIPLFNAADWIGATIASACAQTHRELQIIVVDDGSTDAGAAIVDELARHDSRITLIRQPNGGVARARNAGIDAAVGAFIAPLDADDLWSPRKLELQLDTLERAPADTALAYNWFRRIDANDRVLAGSPHPRVEGSVFARHLDWNFISNGSTPLVRSEVARDIRYDPALRDAGNEGTEDYLFQLQVARHHRFVCAPYFLTGYRALPHSMGAAPLRMARSHLQTFATIARDAPPEARAIIDRRSAGYRLAIAGMLARQRDPRFIAALTRLLFSRPQTLAEAALRRGRTKPEPAWLGATSTPFAEHDIASPDGPWQTRRSPALLARLAELDAQAVPVA